MKIDAYKPRLLEGTGEAKATNDATLRCPAAFVRDLQTFFGENDDGLKSRTAGREFALDVDNSYIDEPGKRRAPATRVSNPRGLS